MLNGVRRNLRDAQRELLTFVDADTYLVGHSVDSDLRALKLVHRRLIDTSELYPSPRGAPFKNGLRLLSQTILGQAIQGSDAGHDSKEDAYASLELALLKMCKGPGFGVPPVWAAKPNPPKESLFETLERLAPTPLSCKVCGDLEARASAEHPPRTPLWSVYNCGYRREQDAVWAAGLFKESPRVSRPGGAVDRGEGPGSEEHSSGGGATRDNSHAAAAVAKIAVEAAHHPTGKGMFRDALGSLEGSSPSLLWVDFPCDGNAFDQGGRGGGGEGGAAVEASSSSSWGAGKGGGGDDRHWSSLPQVDRAVSQLYDSMAEGTLLVVVCQGAISPMVGLMSRKTKSKWDSNKKEPEITVGEKRGRSQISTFDRQDEDELMMATSECLNGMCFLASK